MEILGHKSIGASKLLVKTRILTDEESFQQFLNSNLWEVF